MSAVKPCTISSFTAGRRGQSTQSQHKGHWAVWEEDIQVWKRAFEQAKFKKVQEERGQRPWWLFALF